jgi:alpha-ketoglutarate-dependent taurine dioxygenase
MSNGTSIIIDERRGVVLFRGMKLNDQPQLAVAKRLGAVREEGEGGLMKVTFDKKENPVDADYLVGTFFCHMDGTYDEVPPLASILSPPCVPRWPRRAASG